MKTRLFLVSFFLLLTCLVPAPAFAAAPQLATSEPLREGTLGTLRLWPVSGRVPRTSRWGHPSFKIRIGRQFSINIPKN